MTRPAYPEPHRRVPEALLAVKPTARGPDGPHSIHHREIEQAAVGQAKRQVRASLIDCHQVERIQRCDAAFDLESR
jgi:hypothetical protein